MTKTELELDAEEQNEFREHSSFALPHGTVISDSARLFLADIAEGKLVAAHRLDAVYLATEISENEYKYLLNQLAIANDIRDLIAEMHERCLCQIDVCNDEILVAVEGREVENVKVRLKDKNIPVRALTEAEYHKLKANHEHVDNAA